MTVTVRAKSDKPWKRASWLPPTLRHVTDPYTVSFTIVRMLCDFAMSKLRVSFAEYFLGSAHFEIVHVVQ